jgi:glucokinase
MCAITPEAPWIVALDVGGSSVKSGAFSPSGALLAEPITTRIASQGPAELIFETLTAVIKREVACIPEKASSRVALGFPGPFDYARGVSWIRDVAKFDALYGMDVGKALSLPLGYEPRQLSFMNDAEAAILGETQQGAGRGVSRVIGVTLGTGIGSAFMIDGKPVTAQNGVPEGGQLFPCKWGDVVADHVFSTRGLQRRMETAGFVNCDARTLLDRAQAGEVAARAVWTSFGTDLGRFLHPYAHGFDADAVVVLGGLSAGWDWFGPALRQELAGVSAKRGTLGASAALEGLRISALQRW